MEEIVNKNNEIVLFNDVCNIIDQIGRAHV